MSLTAAYKALPKKTLISQVQGDCGVFSFWFATLLLRHLDPTNREVVYPRGGVATQLKATNPGESARHFAKHTVGSGQGELLTGDEIRLVVEHFGYTATPYTPEAGTRAEFITDSLDNDRPVLFAYIMGTGRNPVTSGTATGKAEVDYGSHWSLIIAETTNEYWYIEPNVPTELTKRTKHSVLASNAAVDDVTYARYWKKTKTNGETGVARVGDIPGLFAKILGKFKTVYDIGKRNRQNLNNVLIAVS